MNKIWFAWLCLPNNYKGIAKIERYNKVKQTCVVTIGGGITVEVPMKWMNPFPECVLPWEEKNE